MRLGRGLAVVLIFALFVLNLLLLGAFLLRGSLRQRYFDFEISGINRVREQVLSDLVFSIVDIVSNLAATGLCWAWRAPKGARCEALMPLLLMAACIHHVLYLIQHIGDLWNDPAMDRIMQSKTVLNTACYATAIPLYILFVHKLSSASDEKENEDEARLNKYKTEKSRWGERLVYMGMFSLFFSKLIRNSLSLGVFDATFMSQYKIGEMSETTRVLFGAVLHPSLQMFFWDSMFTVLQLAWKEDEHEIHAPPLPPRFAVYKGMVYTVVIAFEVSMQMPNISNYLAKIKAIASVAFNGVVLVLLCRTAPTKRLLWASFFCGGAAAWVGFLCFPLSTAKRVCYAYGSFSILVGTCVFLFKRTGSWETGSISKARLVLGFLGNGAQIVLYHFVLTWLQEEAGVEDLVGVALAWVRIDGLMRIILAYTSLICLFRLEIFRQWRWAQVLADFNGACVLVAFLTESAHLNHFMHACDPNDSDAHPAGASPAAFAGVIAMAGHGACVKLSATNRLVSCIFFLTGEYYASVSEELNHMVAVLRARKAEWKINHAEWPPNPSSSPATAGPLVTSHTAPLLSSEAFQS